MRNVRHIRDQQSHRDIRNATVAKEAVAAKHIIFLAVVPL